MAKTAWNAIITSESAGSLNEISRTSLLKQARACLGLSRHILDKVGSEGDAGGPLVEMQVLNGLLKSEANRKGGVNLNGYVLREVSARFTRYLAGKRTEYVRFKRKV